MRKHDLNSDNGIQCYIWNSGDLGEFHGRNNKTEAPRQKLLTLVKPAGFGRNYLGPPTAGCRQVWQCRPQRCQRSGPEWTWQSGWWRDPGNVCPWTGFEPFLDRPADRKAATPCSGNQAPTPPDAASHITYIRLDLYMEANRGHKDLNLTSSFK